MAKLETLKGQVELVLANYPETRDSDIELTIRIWKSFYESKIWHFEKAPGREFVDIKDLFDLPREDNVKRIRATIQNDEGRYLPTDWIIAKRRGIEEEKWRNFMGYHTGNPNQSTLI